MRFVVDTTSVSALKGDGDPRMGAAERDGVAFSVDRRTKERTYLELVGPGARDRLMVFALEVGGRWFEEAKTMIQFLAK